MLSNRNIFIAAGLALLANPANAVSNVCTVGLTNASGYCRFFSNGNDKDASSNNMGSGSWMADCSNITGIGATLSGISVCTTGFSGNTPGDAFPSASTSGVACHCKMTAPYSGAWVLLYYGDRADECAKYCPRECGLCVDGGENELCTRAKILVPGP
jgi:hypothetical protein